MSPRISDLFYTLQTKTKSKKKNGSVEREKSIDKSEKLTEKEKKKAAAAAAAKEAESRKSKRREMIKKIELVDDERTAEKDDLPVNTKKGINNFKKNNVTVCYINFF